jgi:hypothetical protein
MMLAIDFRVVPRGQLSAKSKVFRGAWVLRQSLRSRGGFGGWHRGHRREEEGGRGNRRGRSFAHYLGIFMSFPIGCPYVYLAYLSYSAPTCGTRAVFEEPPEAFCRLPNAQFKADGLREVPLYPEGKHGVCIWLRVSRNQLKGGPCVFVHHGPRYREDSRAKEQDGALPPRGGASAMVRRPHPSPFSDSGT